MSKIDIKTQYLPEFDYLRAISAMSVLAIHVTSIPVGALDKNSFSFLIFYSVNRILQFSVPLFLLMSALLESYQFQRKETICWKQFYQNKSIRILVPYLLWSVIYLFFYTFVYRYYSFHQLLDGKQLLHFFLLGKSSYHLYFMIILIQFYLVFPFLITLYKLAKKYTWTIIVFQYILQILLVKVLGSKVYAIFPDIVNTYLWYFFILNSALVIGFHYSKHTFLNRKILIFLSFIALSTGFYYVFKSFQIEKGLSPNITWYLPVWYLYTFSISLLLLVFCRFLTKKSFVFGKQLQEIGKYSYGIYFLHPMYLLILNSILNRLTGLNSFSYGLVILFIYVVSLYLSYQTTKILSNFRYTALLFGIRKI